MNDLESTVRSRLHDLAGALPDEDGAQNAVGARARHHRQRRNRMAVLAVCAGLLVIAGGSTAAGALLSSPAPGGDVVTGPVEVRDPTASTSPAPTPTAVPPTPPAPTPSTPTQERPAATAEDPGGAPPAPTSSAPTSSAPTGTVPTGPASSVPSVEQPAGWPPEANAVQGGVYWAVYLELYRTGDPGGGQDALAALHELGYDGGIGGVGCDMGAAEALGLDPNGDYSGVSVFFDTADDAQRFVDLYQPGVVGTARITAYCLD